MPKIYKRNCDCCGSFYHGQGAKFCSSTCAKKKFVPHNKGRLSGKNVSCPLCKKEFYLQPSQLKRGIKYCSYECRSKSITIWNKGLTKENDIRVAKNANSLKGRKSTCYWLGKKRLHMSGEKHPQWKGGVTETNHLIRQSPEYKNWRRSVYLKDEYTCQECGVKHIDIVAHHIMPFAKFPEFRFDINNGRTLCRKCHLRLELSLR